MLSEVENAEGRNNELVSLYISATDSISRILNLVEVQIESLEELDENSRMKYSLKDTYQRIIEELEIRESIPESGMAIFCGRIQGDTEIFVFEDEIVETITETSYSTGRKFQTDKLREIIEEDSNMLLLLVDLERAIIGKLVGDRPEVIREITGEVPSKHSKGGQSQARFERRREQQKKSLYKNIGSTVKKISETTVDLNTVVVGGSGISVDEFLNTVDLESRFENIIRVDSVEYINETGLERLAEQATQHRSIENQRIETKVLEDFYEKVNSGDPVVYGIGDVEKALNLGAVKKLIVHQNAEFDIPVSDLVQHAENIGSDTVHLKHNTEKADMFLNGFGGIAAILNFEIQ